jgi:hypothetical protein
MILWQVELLVYLFMIIKYALGYVFIKDYWYVLGLSRGINMNIGENTTFIFKNDTPFLKYI